MNIQLLPDGRLLLSGYPAVPNKIYNVESGQLSDVPSGAEGITGAVSEGNRLFLAAGEQVRVLDADFTEVARLDSPVAGATLAPLALGRNSRASDRGVVYAWAGDQLVAIDAQTLDIRSICQGPFAGISGLSKDGHLVFAQVEEGRATMVDPDTGDRDERSFEVYQGRRGSAICALGRGPEGKIYGTNIYGMHLCAIDPDTDAIEDLGYTWSWRRALPRPRPQRQALRRQLRRFQHRRVRPESAVESRLGARQQSAQLGAVGPESEPTL